MAVDRINQLTQSTGQSLHACSVAGHWPRGPKNAAAADAGEGMSWSGGETT